MSEKQKPGKIVHPHDRFFKRIFKQKKHAIDYFQQYFPEPMQKNFVLEKAELVSSSFEEKDLKKKENDIIFRVPYAANQESFAYIYTLLEHESSSNSYEGLKILHYMWDFWEGWRLNHPTEELPVIIAMVIYHGKTPWPRAPQFLSEFKALPALNDNLLPYIPNYSYILNDLQSKKNDQIQRKTFINFVELVLKNAWHRKLQSLLCQWVAEFWIIVCETEERLQDLQTILIYVYTVNKHVDTEQLSEQLALVSHKAKEVAMGAADKIEERGYQRGLTDGCAKILISQLKLRFALSEIPDAILVRIKSASEEELEKWGTRVISAETLDEVFEY